MWIYSYTNNDTNIYSNDRTKKVRNENLVLRLPCLWVPGPGFEPVSPALQTDTLSTEQSRWAAGPSKNVSS